MIYGVIEAAAYRRNVIYRLSFVGALWHNFYFSIRLSIPPRITDLIPIQISTVVYGVIEAAAHGSDVISCFISIFTMRDHLNGLAGSAVDPLRARQSGGACDKDKQTQSCGFPQ